MGILWATLSSKVHENIKREESQRAIFLLASKKRLLFKGMNLLCESFTVYYIWYGHKKMDVCAVKTGKMPLCNLLMWCFFASPYTSQNSSVNALYFKCLIMRASVCAFAKQIIFSAAKAILACSDVRSVLFERIRKKNEVKWRRIEALTLSLCVT